jgi:hypothetical protein
MNERRKFKRYDLEVPATIETLDGTAKKKTLSLNATNVCAGGAYFRTPHALTEGTEVRVEMILTINGLKILREENRSRILVAGTVLRSGENGMAIRFSEDYSISPLPA